MPLALLLRLLLRYAGALVFWRVATARRGAYGSGRPLVAGTPTRARLELRERVARWREGASLAWRVTSLTVLLVVVAVLIAAGLGPAILGPRWLGVSLLVLASIACGAALAEVIAVQRLLSARRRRRHDRDLTREIYP